MNLFATLRFWWKAMVNRSRIGREVEEEFKFHIDAYVADLIRQGIAPVSACLLPARRAASIHPVEALRCE
jgi:hypothetical protein